MIVPERETVHDTLIEPMEELAWMAANSGASNIPALQLTQREVAEERKRLRKIEARRIRAGFYQGTEPRDEG